MQEGTLALMQLAKTVAATERLRLAGVPFISIMSDPTTGGVFASFAALGDVNLAEPNALIGFAGARVNAGTIGGSCPTASSVPSSCSGTASSTGSSIASELRSEVAALLAFLEPAEQRADDDEHAGNGSLPGFRPLSFLTALADKVIPEGDTGVAAGTGSGAGGGAGSGGNGPGSSESVAALSGQERDRG